MHYIFIRLPGTFCSKATLRVPSAPRRGENQVVEAALDGNRGGKVHQMAALRGRGQVEHLLDVSRGQLSAIALQPLVDSANETFAEPTKSARAIGRPCHGGIQAERRKQVLDADRVARWGALYQLAIAVVHQRCPRSFVLVRQRGKLAKARYHRGLKVTLKLRQQVM